MRAPESKIKVAILHAEGRVRLTALQYFTESYTDDPSIMPVVMQAVERYRDRTAFDLLAHANHLPQTAATVDWVMNQLRRPFDTTDDDDNLRFALARILLDADPDLLARRHDAIMTLDNFPQELRGLLGEALKLEFADWPTLWTAFENLGRKTMMQGATTRTDNLFIHRLIMAMARHPKEGGNVVLEMLHRLQSGYDKPVMVWLEPELVELAGLMKLKAAVPLLMERFDVDDEGLRDRLGTALTRIGSDAVEAVVQKWLKTTMTNKYTLIEPLECIHSDLAVKKTLWLLAREKDFDMRMGLALAAVRQFATESIDPVREVLLEPVAEESGEYWYLRHALVAIATIMGARFPEYDDWHKQAVATDYGFEQIKDKLAPFRLADSYSEDGSRKPEIQIIAKSMTAYQLKITLKNIKPPIWRRLLVPDCTLDDLHEMIQIAMGWENYHLYAFKIGPDEFTHPDADEGELNMGDATETMLSDVIAEEKERFGYQYDFGDDWRHQIVVEKIVHSEVAQKHPVCLTGSRACPPEDVGGHWGYAEYLEALADPKHERHEELLKWRGKFAPEAFDCDAVNMALRKVFR